MNEIDQLKHDIGVYIGINSELLEENEELQQQVAELMASVERLRMSLQAFIDNSSCWANFPHECETAEHDLEMPPQTSLAEIQAQAIERACNQETIKNYGYGNFVHIDELKKYANQLRNQSKEGE